MVMLAPAPGAPLSVTIFTPAAFPCNACIAVVTGTLANSLPPTDEIAPVKSLRFTLA